MVAIEERVQSLEQEEAMNFFKVTILLRYSVFLLQFLKLKTAVCNTENVST